VLALQIAYAAFSFATVVVLTRLLGTSGYGVYAYVIAWVSLLAVPATLGFDRLAVRELATYRAEQRWDLIRGLVRRANQIVVAFSVCMGGIAAVLGLTLLPSSTSATFALGMALVPITALTLLRQSSLQSLDRAVLSQLPELLVRPLLMLAFVAGIWLLHDHGFGPSMAMTINVAIAILAFFLGALLFRRSVPDRVRGASPTFMTSTWGSAALPMMVISGIWIVNGYVGTVMLGSLVDSSSAGIYAVASRAADLVVMGMLAINVPLAPRIARLYAAGDREELQRLVSRAARMTLIWSVPVGVALIVFRDDYLGFFGSGFSGGGLVLAVVVAGQLINVMAGPVGILALMTGFERRAALFVAVGTGLNVALNAILDPVLGLSGAAVGAVASITFWNVALAAFCVKRLGVYPTVMGKLRWRR
jgi:O-antigen/teichoic acid export membrane protein